jgi:hypothetical protein
MENGPCTGSQAEGHGKGRMLEKRLRPERVLEPQLTWKGY